VSKNLTVRNIIQVQQFGDSVRLEVEKKGDTIIKHYIDLKGLAGDNFDDSYNSVCTYKEVLNDSTINPTAYIITGGFKFYFDRKSVLTYCDSIIKGLKTGFDPEVTKSQYDGLKKYIREEKLEKGNIITFSPGYDAELLRNFKTKIVSYKPSQKAKSLLIEFYKTEFSGGQNFYVITNKNDTIPIFQNMDYIN
jgi:hypothetical protein